MIEESSHNAKPAPAPNVDLEQAYANVGRMLLVTEAAVTSIGIPWLPPTPRTLALRREFYPPMKDFVRQSLVNVPTTELEFYAEDLESLPADDACSRKLHIGGLGMIERNMLTAVLFASCFGLFFALTLWVRGGLGLALGLSFLVASVVAAVSGYVCSEDSRRSTFHWLIFEELLRRKGHDEPGLQSLPLTNIGLQAGRAVAE